jgi:cobalamin-dependent methionine synthase I
MVGYTHISRFTFEEVCPDLQELQLFLKATETDDDYPVNVAYREIMSLLADNSDIAGGYIIRKAEDTPLNLGAQVQGYIRGASHLALFVCTAGQLFSRLAEQYNKNGAYLEAFIVDAIGSLTVENAMNKIQVQLEIVANANGKQITNRYSPGYCNWALSNQRELFEYMINVPVNVTLTDSCLMLPIKSVSGIIGIGETVKKREYACQICKNKDCIYRKLIK